MGFYKKTILLSNHASYDKGMAILTIDKTNGGIFGNIKCYNIPKYNNLVLGISVDGRPAIKQNVVFLNTDTYSFKLNNDFQIDGKIGCVLADVGGKEVNALIWGTNGAKAEYKEDIINVLEMDYTEKTNSMQKNKSIEDKAIFETNTEACVEIEKPDTYVSKQEVLSPELFETSEDEVEEIIDETLNSDDFFGMIGDQIDELFNKFPLHEKLNKAVPNSKWVKVDYESDGKEYVLGLIYEYDDVKYICYGVPSRFDVAPPPDLQPYSQWLQLEGDDGFWIMYQDAKSGDSVVLDDVKDL